MSAPGRLSGWPAGDRWSWLLVAVLAAHTALVAYSSLYHAPAWDEYAHLPSGILHWRDGDYRLYKTNPPLVRMIAALPLLFTDVAHQLPAAPADDRPEWRAAETFIELAGQRLPRYYVWARLMLLPLLLLGPLCTYLWARSLWGPAAGLASAVLYCSSPTVLANSALMTPDAVAAALGVTAMFLYRRWLRDATSIRKATLTGLALGAALASKFTMMLLLPFWFMAPWWLLRRYGGTGRRRALTLWLGQLVAAALLLNAVYRFQGTGASLATFTFQSRRLQTLTHLVRRLPGGDGLPMPVPSQFLLGIDRQFAEFERGYWSYLRGTWKFGGWWYYYLYGLAVKEPTALWLLLGWFLLRAARRGFPFSEQCFLIGPAAVILGVLSAHTGFNHHIRYALPALPFVAVCCAAPIKSDRNARSQRRSMVGVRFAVVLVALAAGSSLSQWPHSESYFCWLAGGPRRGALHLLDSNIDWGQDVSYLARWLREHPDQRVDGIIASVPFSVLRVFGLRRGSEPQWQRRINADGTISLSDPPAGRYAVFVRRIYESWAYHYFRFLEPRFWVSPSVRIYELRPEDIDRLRPHMRSCTCRFPRPP